MPDSTKRILTDETGQDIVTALNSLVNAVDPTGAADEATTAASAANTAATAANNAATQAGYVNISSSKSNHVVTIQTTNKSNTTTTTTITEPTASFTSNDGNVSLSITTGDGTQTVTIPNPNKELSDRAHVETVSRSKTRTGNPIQIEDAVNEIADKTVIKLVPKQDLHGYSKPWVGGAGKNKWGPNLDASFSKDSSTLYLNASLALPAGTYTVSGLFTCGDTTSNAVRFAFRNDSSALTYITIGANSGNRTSNTVTLESACTKVYIYGSNSTSTAYALTATDVQVESGASATDYEPYSNICPISGYDTVNLMRRGNGNLFNGVFTDNKYITSAGSTATINSGYKAATDYIPVKENTAYTISGIGVNNRVADATPATSKVTFYNSSKTVVTGMPQSDAYATNTFTFITPAGTAYIKFHCGIGATDVVVNEGSKSEFAHYPIAVSLATNGNQTAGTVYSGTVTLLADGSGQVKSDYAIGDLGSLTWQYNNGIFIAQGFSGQKSPASESVVQNMVCSALPVIPVGDVASLNTGIGGRSNGWYRAYYPGCGTDATAFKTAMTGVTLCYELATPLTFTLTANQVQTLLGYNYIYTDGTEIALTYRQESLATNETLLKLLPTGMATGNPVTFSDGADSVPLKQLVVNVEPKQDLHGYEKPWVAGAGKNKLPMTLDAIKAANTSGTWNGNVYTYRSIAFTINTDDAGNVVSIGANGTATGGNADLGIYVPQTDISAFVGMKLNGSTGGSTSTYGLAIQAVGIVQYNGEDYTIPSEYSDKQSIYFRVANGKSVSYIAIYPMVRLSTVTDATFEPYTNLCPIRGWDSVPLLREGGKNLLDDSKPVSFGRYVNGVWEAVNTRMTTDYYRIDPNTSYTVSVDRNNTKDFGIIGFNCFDKDKNYLTGSTAMGLTISNVKNYTFTIATEGVVYIRFTMQSYASASTNISSRSLSGAELMLEKGSTITAYEPYNGKTYDISIPSEAGTVYGGTITLDENGEGELIVTYKSVRVGDLPWALNSNTNVFYCMGAGHKKGYDGIISSHYKTVSTGHATMNDKEIAGVSDSNAINLKDTSYSTVASMANNDAQIVYELATPITYTLTANQVKTLLGTNIISSDAGTVEIEYFSDISASQTARISSAISELPSMVVLSYGSSTWSDFINAYKTHTIVYCRASSNSNPASGSQTRMAFMAYVNNAETPTEVEFQYYRSVSSKSATQLDDQVFIYKLTSGGVWSVTTREAAIKQIVFDESSGLKGTFNNGVLTISAAT